MHSLNPVLSNLSRKNSVNTTKLVNRRTASCFFKDTGDAPYDKLMRSYETAVHYSKQDLKDMGRDIGRSIYFFANLQVNKDIQKEVKISSNEDDGGEGDDDSSPEAVIEVIPGVPLGTIENLDSDMLLQPLLKPCVFSMQAIANADQFSKGLLRIKCEIAIRKSKSFGGFECQPLPPGPRTAGQTFTVSTPENLDSEEEGGENCDSDSEPSIDNMPFTKKKNFSNLNEQSLVKAVQKAALKRKITLEKNAKAASKNERIRLDEAAISAITVDRELSHSKSKKGFGTGFEALKVVEDPNPKRLQHRYGNGSAPTENGSFKLQSVELTVAEKLKLLGRVSNLSHLPKSGRKEEASSNSYRRVITPTKHHYFLTDDHLGDNGKIDGRHHNDSKQFGVTKIASFTPLVTITRASLT